MYKTHIITSFLTQFDLCRWRHFFQKCWPEMMNEKKKYIYICRKGYTLLSEIFSGRDFVIWNLSSKIWTFYKTLFLVLGRVYNRDRDPKNCDVKNWNPDCHCHNKKRWMCCCYIEIPIFKNWKLKILNNVDKLFIIFCNKNCHVSLSLSRSTSRSPSLSS